MQEEKKIREKSAMGHINHADFEGLLEEPNERVE